ncbi:hypothetical protein OVA24_17650 [Luteolibacter sp. SL250]|uniref:hypothetical protein n=1 Tax=Luteolibacter sp. SL250 TaxID=2995170 RepID=UPI0022703918|nr:hypothetical protein [Luteolibacter sp. SL250]WAC19055.1 hypothetical protein OVA24_17650 [Luteolibacter sp. SL250]
MEILDHSVLGMLRLLIPLVLVASSVLSLSHEIVTLNRGTPTVALNPTDLVKIIGGSQVRSSAVGISGVPRGYMTMAGSSAELNLSIHGIVNSLVVPFDTMSGLTSIRLGKSAGDGGASSDLPNADVFLVLQITRAGQHLFSDSLVTPGSADAKYDVVLETSTDMVNWSPGAPGEYLGSTGQRFFRVRATVK